MKLTPHIVILTILICIACSSIISDVKDNVLSFLVRSVNDPDTKNVNKRSKDVYFKEKIANLKDNAQAKKAHNLLKTFGRQNKDWNNNALETKTRSHLHKGKAQFLMDPVLNLLTRRRSKSRDKKSKERYKKKSKDSDSSNWTSTSSESSSSQEIRDWKDEWREHWIQKKYEATNSSQPTGDTVNMLAARPWGVPCGDPNQHDMPWGTCMLPMECEAEYRIYRGDHFCGRTHFICCGLQLTNYDMYQGFDVSFADSDLKTDSEEIRNRFLGSREKKRKKKRKDRRKRIRDRRKRKRDIKKKIRKILRQMRKVLSKAYRNGTKDRRKKTKQLKKFIKYLKKQFKKERKAVSNIHELELKGIDEKLKWKLDQIKIMNNRFIENQTFREIVVNGSLNEKDLRMLMLAYPELTSMLDSTRRRSNVEKPDYLQYDVEYGLLYY